MSSCFPFPFLIVYVFHFFLHVVCKDVATAKIEKRTYNNETVMSVSLSTSSIDDDFKENCTTDSDDIRAMFYVNKQHEMIPIFDKRAYVTSYASTMKVL